MKPRIKKTGYTAVVIGCLMFSIPWPSTAQWHQMNGLEGGSIVSFAKSPGYLFAGTDKGGVFRSRDNGLNWEPAHAELGAQWIRALAVCGDSTIVAGTWLKGVFRSEDNGMHWTPADSGLPDLQKEFIVDCIYAADGILYMGATSNLFISADSGKSWYTPDSGFQFTGGVTLACNESDLLAGSRSGVFISRDRGKSWHTINPEFTQHIISLAVHRGTVYAGTLNNGLFCSIDSCRTWRRVVDIAFPGDASFNCIAAVDSIVVLGTYSTILASNEAFSSWNTTNREKIGFSSLKCLFETGGLFFAGTDNGVLCSQDSGQTWSWRNTGLYSRYIGKLVVANGTLFSGGENGVYACGRTSEGFTESNSGLNYATGEFRNANDLAVYQNHMFASTFGGGIYHSAQSGTAWSAHSTPLHDRHPSCVAVDERGGLLAGVSHKIFRSDSSRQIWTELFRGLNAYIPGSVRSIQVHGDTLCALIIFGMDIYDGPTSFHIVRSTDDGAHWALIDSGLPGGRKMFLESDSAGALYTAVDSIGVFSSYDYGTCWNPVGGCIPNKRFLAFVVYNGQYFLGTEENGVFVLSPGKETWKQVNDGMEGISVSSLAGRSDTVFAGTTGRSVWIRRISEMFEEQAVPERGNEADSSTDSLSAISHPQYIHQSSRTGVLLAIGLLMLLLLALSVAKKKNKK